MKKPIILSIAATLLLFAACNKDDNHDNGNVSESDNSTYIVDGATKSVFSVDEGRTVRFSHGNLQYQASTNTWRFAEHQYDYIGEGNAKASPNYEGWIDLFCWATSGWAGSGATFYHPWDTAFSNSLGNQDYLSMQYGPADSSDLTGIYANADWGVYNKISNGGNRIGIWRTLTFGEWKYLFNTRPNALDKYGVAIIDGKYKGLIVLPDIWDTPTEMTFVSCCNGGDRTDYSQNQYTIEQWQKMEAAGAIFLPAAGDGEGADVGWIGIYGNYWTSSYGNDRGAAYRFFNGNTCGGGIHVYRNYRFSVRLVCDKE